MPGRRMGEWMYGCTFSSQGHQMDVSGQLHAPASLLPWENPGRHYVGDLLGPRTGLDDMEEGKILPLPGPELLARR
jgi:hypothetical protein